MENAPKLRAATTAPSPPTQDWWDRGGGEPRRPRPPQPDAPGPGRGPALRGRAGNSGGRRGVTSCSLPPLEPAARRANGPGAGPAAIPPAGSRRRHRAPPPRAEAPPPLRPGLAARPERRGPGAGPARTRAPEQGRGRRRLTFLGGVHLVWGGGAAVTQPPSSRGGGRSLPAGAEGREGEEGAEPGPGRCVAQVRKRKLEEGERGDREREKG